jgi:uncharacterized protein (TIGR03437 family)
MSACATATGGSHGWLPHILLLLCALSAHGATFGKLVPLLGGSADIVLDETRNQLYLTSSTENYVQVYSIAKQSFLTPIPTDQTPLSAAISRSGTNLYVTCYNSQVLDVINLDTLTVSAQINLPAKPEGVAVGSDERVLISTTSSGTANLLMIYNPSPTAATALTSISVTLSTPTAPTFPPPSGRPFLSTHSQLRATRDGSLIAGVNVPSSGSPSLFVYQTASGTVPLARIVTGTSTTLAISDDGARIMCGAILFNASTLQVLAQQNLSNSPYPITPGTSFTTQANQGGAIFSPDGTSLYSVLNIAPVTNSTATSTISQLMVNDPDNLLIKMGIQLPENLSGKMVVSADGTNAYALSDSGFTTLPLGTLAQSPIAVPAAQSVLLTSDPCGVTSATSSVAVTVNNAGKGSLTATAALLRYSNANTATESSATTAPTVRTSGSQLIFSFNSAAAKQRGTVTPPHDFLVTSTQAVNIPNSVRAYENARDSNARGTIVPLAVGPSAATPLPDLVYDQTRQRLYIANYGLNRVEVYDIQGQAFLTPIKVGQLPNSLALTPDGFTLYVANSGGETISIVNPDTMQVTGTVSYPPVAFNATTALSLPSVIAFGLSGLQIMNTDGSLWKVVGTSAVPRPASVLLGGTLPVKLITPGATASLTMAATPAGEYILFATSTGIAYLYDATADDFVAEKTIFATTTQSGYIGPVAAGPGGQYYVMGGVLLNADLTIAGTNTAAGTYSAVAAAGTSTYSVFTPVAATSTTPPSVTMLNAKTGNTTNTVSALEGPITQLATTITGPGGPGGGFGATTRGFVGGRTMAIDAAGANAYAITASGLSIIPLAGPTQAQMPVPSKGGAVNLASYTAGVAPNGLLSIFGQNFGTLATPPSTPLPLIMGGTCVTLNNVALPLLLTSPQQINAQIPPGTAAGTYPLVVRSIANLAASASENVTVAKYAPAVFVDSTGQLALFHANGQYVSKNNPATRDEPLTMYATGLGATTGGAVTAGNVSPSSPLAVSGTVQVFFGDPGYSQAGVIVDWSGLAPGFIGVYQLNLRIPGTHLDGNALPVTLTIGGVSSPTTGPAVPYVAVD